MHKSGSIQDYDWWLLATAFAICGVGVLEIWSATHTSHLAGMHSHQVEWIGLGFVLMLLLPRALIRLQPDLGTALVLVPLAAVGAYLAGLQWKHSLAIVALAAIMVPVGYHFLKPYQRERVTTFLRPEEDPKGAGYQILQSKIAVGSGGFWGKGLGNGSQNQLGFVPVRYSDFILAALAE